MPAVQSSGLFNDHLGSATPPIFDNYSNSPFTRLSDPLRARRNIVVRDRGSQTAAQSAWLKDTSSILEVKGTQEYLTTVPFLS